MSKEFEIHRGMESVYAKKKMHFTQPYHTSLCGALVWLSGFHTTIKDNVNCKRCLKKLDSQRESK